MLHIFKKLLIIIDIIIDLVFFISFYLKIVKFLKILKFFFINHTSAITKILKIFVKRKKKLSTKEKENIKFFIDNFFSTSCNGLIQKGTCFSKTKGTSYKIIK